MVFRSVLTPRYVSRTNSYSHPFVVMQRMIDGLDDNCSTTGCAAPHAGEAGAASQMTTRTVAMSVRLDVKEDEKAYFVTADLPGLSDKDVDVSFDDGVLTLKGEKKVSRDQESGTWHINERAAGVFTRQLSLPVAIDIEKIEAKFDKGVLSVTLPKAAPAKPTAKKINVTYN